MAVHCRQKGQSGSYKRGSRLQTGKKEMEKKERGGGVVKYGQIRLLINKLAG